ncbi:extracellular matrix glycoprotein pherophorin-V10 [Volvox carteri f. nagariensis]|uniref:Extracellular matrix glycoprotein pherophorin-V10 n=1 Tax=Volvox carteri f. nagariensis TaxID=3068 RepID=D8TTP9_VOLCA|nr:extracellular matrix glycoprotein pherophorin-V10 [Volvox carteri f. nagariensis]EFJ49346.1 extracellular matrix glycoprotein pherophorin-V10 [Volvox carteri f. nagariensis]|eukprot:XP_002949794.1 extracellular matrix glycoprotein pherophorin-V10 [Volvox carteri f. nagariensis]
MTPFPCPVTQLNVNPDCKVPGVSAVATVNGVRTKIAPVIEKASQGPPSAMILKLTQMGLNLTTADGAEICITLKPNRAGQGCTTLQQLCVPPPGYPNGTCSAALFDTLDDCCPLKEVNVNPCKTCVYFSLTPYGSISRPYSFTPSQCASLATVVANDMKNQADGNDAAISTNFSLVSCEGTQVKICGDFMSDADGAKLKPFIDDMAISWLSQVAGNLSSSCPVALSNYTVSVAVGGNGTDIGSLPPSCLDAVKSTACKPNPFPFPKCVCNITQGVSPFAPSDLITELPGRRSRSILYCFLFKVVDAIPGQFCTNATTFQKVEFWANEAVRTKVLGFSLRAAGATEWKNISTSWGGKGEETLKATPIGWNLGQANGGHVCVEVDRSVSLDTLCLGPTPNTCWINIFDPSRTCCPLYPTYYTQ